VFEPIPPTATTAPPPTLPSGAGQQRSETPDSACDVRSLPNSADSPSSNASEKRSTPDIVDNVGAESRDACGDASLRPNTTIATQTEVKGVGEEEEEEDDDIERLDESKISVDKHCYECKVKYRDPTAKDLVMFLHAWAYSVNKLIFELFIMFVCNCEYRQFFNASIKDYFDFDDCTHLVRYCITLSSLQGPEWHYQTDLPEWANDNYNWVDDHKITEAKTN
jgi:hypothetical protein